MNFLYVCLLVRQHFILVQLCWKAQFNFSYDMKRHAIFQSRIIAKWVNKKKIFFFKTTEKNQTKFDTNILGWRRFIFCHQRATHFTWRNSSKRAKIHWRHSSNLLPKYLANFNHRHKHHLVDWIHVCSNQGTCRGDISKIMKMHWTHFRNFSRVSICKDFRLSFLKRVVGIVQ